MRMHDPNELCDVAIDIARQAGKLQMRELPLGRWRGEGVDEKGGGELVSRVDRASEALIVRQIREAYPDDAVFAEEGGATGDAEATHRWIVDPLDGTVNYLHGHPMFAISIAVEARAGDRPGIIAGVVYAPYLSEMFFAARGHGAYLNSRSVRLSASPATDLGDAVVATGFAYDPARSINNGNFLRMRRATRGIRRCGAAAIDLAYVACGRYDAYWELGLKPWDVAAGALLVREAGGTVADFDGGDGWLEGENIIASGPGLFSQVRERVQRPDDDQ
jgi:myo-inositol-1(or 4)-monophosphatase